MSYTYKLHEGGPKAPHNQYTREELERLATIQLQKLCKEERIITESAYSPDSGLSRQAYIELILRYRGRESLQDFERFDSSSIHLLEDALTRHAMPALGYSVLCPEHITLYKDQPITISDGMKLAGDLEEARLSAAFLLDGEQKLRAIFSVGRSAGAAYLLLSPALLDPALAPGDYRGLTMLFFSHETTRLLLELYHHGIEDPGKLPFIQSEVRELIVRESPVSELPLFMDFGARGTAAGYTQDGVLHRVRMRERVDCEKRLCGGCAACGECFVCPSAAAVKSCVSGEVRLCFGYEAVSQTVLSGYLTSRTVFTDLKRLLEDPERMLPLCDGGGNRASIRAGELLAQYVTWVVQTACANERCLFTQLVLLEGDPRYPQLAAILEKEQQLFLLAEPVDEGFAILYNELEKQIAQRDFGRRRKTLLLNVGGSRASLMLMDYQITEEEIVHKIHLKSRLANLDVRFGGDLLTYRIMQYLKVWLAAWYAGEHPLSPAALLGEFYEDPLGPEEAQPYDALDRAYALAEGILPTRYAMEAHSAEERYLQVKSNFFSLWQLAQKIKTAFYSGDGVSVFDFGQADALSFHRLTSAELWSISVTRKKGLETLTDRPPLTVTRQDVDSLLAPAIYREVAELVLPYCDDDQVLMGCDVVLSGLSARIPLFREAFKEFTVGRRTRGRRTRGGAQTGRLDYKLKCIDGALRFQRDRRGGVTDLLFERCSPLTPYTVTVPRSMGGEVTLFSQLQTLDTVYQTFSRYQKTREVIFSFYRGEALRGRCPLSVDADGFADATYQGLWEQYGHEALPQAELDGIREEEIRFFVYNRPASWGFFTLPVLRLGGTLYAGKETFFPFEQSGWEVDFFGGSM